MFNRCCASIRSLRNKTKADTVIESLGDVKCNGPNINSFGTTRIATNDDQAPLPHRVYAEGEKTNNSNDVSLVISTSTDSGTASCCQVVKLIYRL